LSDSEACREAAEVIRSLVGGVVLNCLLPSLGNRSTRTRLAPLLASNRSPFGATLISRGVLKPEACGNLWHGAVGAADDA